ncbi:hypothetical protein SLE2022_359170 [Rubroshorea leprosula]
MAIFLRGKDCLLSRLKSITRFQRFNYTLDEGGLQAKYKFNREMGFASNSKNSHIGHEADTSKWKKIDARKFGITRDMIPSPSLVVLKILRNNGFEAYLVGGCVRDLLLQRIPKDFDVVTTAELKQIKKKFNRSHIIGKRFPICVVHIKGSAVEVSSFETVANNAKENEDVFKSPLCDEKDFIRWRNSTQRDFTINSLFYDPFSNKIYDYTNGMSDLRSLKLRTLIPAHLSFKEDCARILRGLRIAARLHLSFSKDTERAMRDLSSSIEGLDKFRLMLEMNYMMSYGAAESSICLLQRFNLLEILLPFHAAYLDQQKSAQNSVMLMKLLSNLDKLLSCEQPADSSLWVGLLVFHLALVKNPQDALVVWTFASVLFHGKWEEGLKFAREHANMQVTFVPEISGFSVTKSDEDIAKEVAQLASLAQDSICALTEKERLFELMSRYPFSPCSGLVFIPKRIGNHVAQIFHALTCDIQSYEDERESLTINYSLLGKGNPFETRFVLGNILLETLIGGLVEGETGTANDVYPEATESLLKDQLQVKKGKKRSRSLAEPEQQMVKKPKKQEVVDKEKFQDIAKMHSKAVQMCRLSEEINALKGNQLEEIESYSSNAVEAKKLEKLSSPSSTKKKTRSKHQGGAEKHKTLNRRKTEKPKEVEVGKKDDRPSLSSLFKK